MKTLYALIFSLTLLLSFGCNRPDRVEAAREPDTMGDHSSNLTAEDKEFIKYAAEMHAGEIKMAQLAKEKSSNKDVWNYADSVIAKHTEALKELSDKTDMNLTTRNTNPSIDTQYHVQYLTPLSGPKFDEEFITLMIADHKDAANVFKEQIDKTQNKQFRTYISDTQASLEKGWHDAEGLQKSLSTSASK